MAPETTTEWRKTACILCSLNCGLEVQVGGPDGRHLVKIKGDREHPISQGYLCEKAQRLDYYQTAGDRLDTPLRRRPDGSFEPIDWDTAIREVAARFLDIKARYGGDKVLYYGGGGQGNHLGGSYGSATLAAIGNRYRSNALAQEKTGEFWVNGRMIGAGTHGDYDHCEVAVFIGKNPWQSHGFARARACIREIVKDPKRSMVVIDPRRSETAEKADFHLAIKPGTDAWCLAALVAIIVQENLARGDWLAEHSTGFEEIAPRFRAIDVPAYAAACGIEEDLLRRVARRIAGAESVSVYEDLGMQMSVHSTLGSYLQRLIWLLTGNFGRKGTNYAQLPFVSLTGASKAERGKGEERAKVSPVVGAKIITGLIPCNVMAEEILADHPNRYRAMLIESGNPLHSVADSQRMREAMRQLELLVVIDVALSESAREAHYVLPASSQFEKVEATYFNLEFPRNAFHLRHPVMDPLPGTLAEPEIHARLVEAMGELTDADYAPLREAAAVDRATFAGAFLQAMATNPRVLKYAPVVLYRTLGETLPQEVAGGAVYWAFAHQFVQANPVAAARAGFGGDNPFVAGERLFDTILSSKTGVVFSDEDYDATWSRVRMAEHRVNLAIPELFGELDKLAAGPRPRDREFPFILSAGERRSDTTNTIIRNPASLVKERAGTLRMSADDASRLGLADGDRVRVKTRRGSAEVPVEVTAMMQTGHISLPNGQGMDYEPRDGGARRVGVAPNELTGSAERDFLAGTPWHKHVPAQVERIG